MTAGVEREGRPLGLIAAGIVGNALSRKTRAKLERGDSPRTGQPVWRNSYYEGQIEDRLWRPIGIGRQRGTKRGGKRYAALVIRMAEALERRTRRARQQEKRGIRNGALGDVGLGVLKALFELVDFRTGKLEPAIATLAEMTGYCYSAVHEALVRLRQAGFLQWMRRSRPTDNEGQAGPQVEQITNAYALVLPAELDEIARRQLGDGPAPDDATWSREQATRDWKQMLDNLPLTAFASDFTTADRLNGPTLAKIAALLDARDCRERESGRARETGGSF